MKKNNGAVFLDRDGTINEEVGYLDSLGKLRIFPAAFDAVRMINESGMKVVVVTNQSGVARGLFDEAFVKELHEHIDTTFKSKGARIDRFYYCPHHPPEGIGRYVVSCSCRKPEPGMLLQASEDLAIDLPASYMVGDTARDIGSANRAGATGILVKTGYGKEVAPSGIRAAYIAEDILDAAQWILGDRTR
ncbi:MAG: D-glycero-beta-D-manno-heptose 1,7-bisphosphate 7-phosphatase [Syntrophobacterales bacterium]|nr:MAG: D-glycero-beta-D-manno-heptose 1,7-bisphosphate 7-phosphatase [Syntrophobacterales bacterium]